MIDSDTISVLMFISQKPFYIWEILRNVSCCTEHFDGNNMHLSWRIIIKMGKFVHHTLSIVYDFDCLVSFVAYSFEGVNEMEAVWRHSQSFLTQTSVNKVSIFCDTKKGCVTFVEKLSTRFHYVLCKITEKLPGVLKWRCHDPH